MKDIVTQRVALLKRYAKTVNIGKPDEEANKTLTFAEKTAVMVGLSEGMSYAVTIVARKVAKINDQV